MIAVLAAAVVLLAPSAASADSATILLGARSIQKSVGSQPAGQAAAFKVTSASSGTAQSISLYVDRRNRAKSVRVGLYSNAGRRPDALLAEGTRSSLKRSGWNRITIAPTAIIAGTRYWLAIRGSGGRIYFRDRGSSTRCTSKTSPESSRAKLASRWKTARTQKTCGLSAYVSGIAAAAPTAPAASTAPACDRTANSAATLGTEFSAASAGQSICLAAGDYGTFKGDSKSGPVTIRSQEGTSATMAVDLDGASNITFDSLTIKELLFGKSVHDVTVRNSRFTGFAYIDATGMRNAAILFDRNTHIDINMPNEQTPPGRVHIDGGEASNSADSVVVRDSLFKGGTADGIRVDGGASATIEGNEFTQIKDVDPYHADPIQFYGGRNVVIRANYFHDQAESASCSLGQHDGGGGNLIERNVIVGGNCYFGVYLRADQSSIVRHNTFAFTGTCLSGTPCGLIRIDGKTAGGSGTVIENNIFGALENTGSFPSLFTARNNLTRRRVAGIANITGTPVFTGGANPTDYAGYRLAPASPGKNAASDGTDIGI